MNMNRPRNRFIDDEAEASKDDQEEEEEDEEDEGKFLHTDLHHI